MAGAAAEGLAAASAVVAMAAMAGPVAEGLAAYSYYADPMTAVAANMVVDVPMAAENEVFFVLADYLAAMPQKDHNLGEFFHLPCMGLHLHEGLCHILHE